MAQPMTDYDEDVLAALITADAERSLTSDCGDRGHAWRPTVYGRLECERCLYTPHRPTRKD